MWKETTIWDSGNVFLSTFYRWILHWLLVIFVCLPAQKQIYNNNKSISMAADLKKKTTKKKISTIIFIFSCHEASVWIAEEKNMYVHFLGVKAFFCGKYLHSPICVLLYSIETGKSFCFFIRAIFVVETMESWLKWYRFKYSTKRCFCPMV